MNALGSERTRISADRYQKMVATGVLTKYEAPSVRCTPNMVSQSIGLSIYPANASMFIANRRLTGTRGYLNAP